MVEREGGGRGGRRASHGRLMWVNTARAGAKFKAMRKKSFLIVAWKQCDQVPQKKKANTTGSEEN